MKTSPDSGLHQRIAAQAGLVLRAMRLVHEGSPRWTAPQLICLVIQSALPVAGLYFMKLLVDALAASQQTPEPTRWRHVTFILAGLGVTLILTQCVRALSSLVTEAQGLDVVESMERIIHRKSVEAGLEYYESAAYRDTLHRAQQEASYRPLRIVQSLAQIAQSILSLVFVGGLIAAISHWWLTLAFVLFGAPALFYRIRHSRKVFAWQRARTGDERKAEYYHWMLTSPGFAKEIRLFGLGPLFEERAASTRASLNRDRRQFATQRAMADAGAQSITVALALIGIGWMSHRALEGALSVGCLIVQYQAFQRGTALVHDLIGGISGIYESQLFLSQLYEFLHLEPRRAAPAVSTSASKCQAHGIQFENVSFGYEGSERLVLKNLSFHIAPGEMVALVGVNGAGKSTLIKLLCGLYAPTAGRIILNGVDVASIPRDRLWRAFSVVFQDFNQYFVTARENIWFGEAGRPHDPSSVMQAARDAGVSGAIEKLPAGYEQLLGRVFEGGQELSAGQWQKLALARAFYRRAKVVILDEPSSALDVQAEHDLFQRFKTLTSGKMSMVISHRLSTVRMADRILLLQDGAIAEYGSHHELLTSGGIYADLFETQASSYR